MRRYLLSFVFLLMNLMPALAYDRHGKYYSVKDGGGSSGLLAVLVIVGIVAYAYFCSGKDGKK